MKELIRNVWMDDNGQDVAEYALLLALVAVLVITAVTGLKDAAVTAFDNASAALKGK